VPSVEEIRAQLTDAMKRRDAVATAALRSVLAAISHASTAGKEKRELSPDDILGVIGREVKKREEAMEAFAAAGRSDRAEAEQAEREVLAAFLPARLSSEELEAIVDEVLATGADAMGPAMKQVMERVKGRADGKVVSDLVKERLGKQRS
jgi:uncharacterized protein YqeY